MAELRVALTFDAEHPSRPHCPPDATERILTSLAEAGVRATFFVQGRWATAYPALARAIGDGGHLIGNHSHHHGRFSGLSPEGVRQDLTMAEESVREAAGAPVRPWFRLPFGDGEGDGGLASILAEAGYGHVGWHVDPHDWDEARSATEIEEAVVRGAMDHGDGAVVLLHAWPASTARALPTIVVRLAGAGAAFVTVDELSSVPG